MNTNLTGPTGIDLHVAITHLTDTHRAQEWHPEWSRHTIITNLIDTMSDIDPTDITDPHVLAVLADPAAATDLARNIDNI